MRLDEEQLAKLAARPAAEVAPRQDIELYLRLLRSHQSRELRRQLSQAMVRHGLQRFIVDTVAPLNEAVGEAWMRGEIAIFEEHLYTELMQGLIRNSITALQSQGNAPRVLLTSLPNEPHSLGLLMVEAMLAAENAHCIPLGTETPVTEIVHAAEAHRANIVALSFSGAYPESKAVEALRELRAMLPGSVLLCAGKDVRSCEKMAGRPCPLLNKAFKPAGPRRDGIPVRFCCHSRVTCDDASQNGKIHFYENRHALSGVVQTKGRSKGLNLAPPLFF